MDESNHKEWILETIDQLRKRKARPDLERICHMLQRRYRLSFPETEACLEKLVDSHIVIKVDYKGSTSYRNAAKWRKNHDVGTIQQGTTDASRKIAAALRVFLNQKSIPTKNPHGDETRKEIHSAIVNEERKSLEAGPGTGFGTKINQLNVGLHKLQNVTEKPILVQDEISEGDPNSLPLSLKLLPTAASNLTMTGPGFRDSSAPGFAVNFMVTAPVVTDDAAGITSSQIPVPLPFKNILPNKGASLDEIQELITQDYPHSVLILGALDSAIEQEIKAGRVVRLQDGTYTLGQDTKVKQKRGPKKSKAEKHKDETPSATKRKENADDASAVSKKAVMKRKRFKKTHGPDFESYGIVPRLQENRCDFCTLTSSCNPRGQPEDLLVCKDCNAKAHPSCMDYSLQLAIRARRSPWQCIDCKTCWVCEDAGDADAMLFCDACDKGYHMNCHNPALTEKPTGKWMCQRCVIETGGIDTSKEETRVRPRTGTSCLPTPSASPVPSMENIKISSPMEPKIEPLSPKETPTPDALSWTIEDVVDYLSSLGFPEQAKHFKEQEIDGQSLLLMRRNDVLTGLSLKLGPAVKIYKYVKNLQSSQ